MKVLFHIKPNYSELKVSGCTCFPYLSPIMPISLNIDQPLAHSLGTTIITKVTSACLTMVDFTSPDILNLMSNPSYLLNLVPHLYPSLVQLHPCQFRSMCWTPSPWLILSSSTQSQHDSPFNNTLESPVLPTTVSFISYYSSLQNPLAPTPIELVNELNALIKTHPMLL